MMESVARGYRDDRPNRKELRDPNLRRFGDPKTREVFRPPEKE